MNKGNLMLQATFFFNMSLNFLTSYIGATRILALDSIQYGAH